mgnify:CR=1 FL=1
MRAKGLFLLWFSLWLMSIGLAISSPLDSTGRIVFFAIGYFLSGILMGWSLRGLKVDR